MKYSTIELMTIIASRELHDGEVVFTGIGLPNLAANLAKKTHAPNLILVYESGVVGATPSRVPLSVADPSLASNSSSICSMYELFSFYLQNGLIDVGYLGGAQVDRYGNINSTVIGDYLTPIRRLPGSGGACDISCLAKKILILMPHELRRFPEKVDFITSPGYFNGKESRTRLGLPGGGPSKVITDLCVLSFNQDGELVLESIHPGKEIGQIQSNTGWNLQIPENIGVTLEPTEEELRVLREVLDPEGLYLK